MNQIKHETGTLSITTSCGELVFATLTSRAELSDKTELEIETYEGFLFFFIYLVFFDYALLATWVLRLRQIKNTTAKLGSAPVSGYQPSLRDAAHQKVGILLNHGEKKSSDRAQRNCRSTKKRASRKPWHRWGGRFTQFPRVVICNVFWQEEN